ncbi:MAG TPA: signal peptidase I [Acidobacteriaceae bacterium]
MSTQAPPPPVAAAPARHHHIHFVMPHLLDTVRSTLTIIIVALFILAFLVQPFRIPSESMERTLLVGDFLLVDKMTFAPAGIWRWLMPYRTITHGDIVVFHFPLDSDEHVVKRVIGVPGDEIALRNGVSVVNDSLRTEPYDVFERADGDEYRDQFPRYTTDDPGVDPHWRTEMRGLVENAHLRVPTGDYFVLGDNRNHSRDSRYWGFVPRANIEGTPLVIYFSLREPSATDLQPLPDGRLGNSVEDRLIDFARWDRILHVVH